MSWVLSRGGLDVRNYRGQPLRRRVSAVLRVLHARTQEQAQQILDERPELLPAAINALLIGVTSFFRDESVFETLRTSVLPQLAMQRRPLRIWSAGCSNGAELYSVAILLAQAGMLEGSFLLGSDCRSEAVEQARAAAYDCDDLRLIEPAVLGKYFEMDGHGINRDGPHFLRKENRVRPYFSSGGGSGLSGGLAVVRRLAFRAFTAR